MLNGLIGVIYIMVVQRELITSSTLTSHHGQ